MTPTLPRSEQGAWHSGSHCGVEGGGRVRPPDVRRGPRELADHAAVGEAGRPAGQCVAERVVREQRLHGGGQVQWGVQLLVPGACRRRVLASRG